MELRSLILFTMFHIVANPYIRLPIPACVTVGSSCVRPYRNFAHTADTPPSIESAAHHMLSIAWRACLVQVRSKYGCSSVDELRTRLVHIPSIVCTADSHAVNCMERLHLVVCSGMTHASSRWCLCLVVRCHAVQPFMSHRANSLIHCSWVRRD